MSPSIPACNHNCLYCWRTRTSSNSRWSGEADDPKAIMDQAIAEQVELLKGFWGTEKCDKKRLKEAENPKHVAISLDGEPTLYPRLNELIDEIHRRQMTSFLVTNGTMPEKISKLTEPTQLYMTLPAPNEDVYEKTCAPLLKDGWKRIKESLMLLQNFRCNTVLRLTLVRDLNLVNPEQYAKLIDKSNVKFVECKAFMAVGGSRERLPYESMPLHAEIKAFAEEVAKHSSYKIKDEKKDSRVVLLTR
jgi:tRNA wybutosine-synthesizing protein 1